ERRAEPRLAAHAADRPGGVLRGSARRDGASDDEREADESGEPDDPGAAHTVPFFDLPASASFDVADRETVKGAPSIDDFLASSLGRREANRDGDLDEPLDRVDLVGFRLRVVPPRVSRSRQVPEPHRAAARDVRCRTTVSVADAGSTDRDS